VVAKVNGGENPWGEVYLAMWREEGRLPEFPVLQANAPPMPRRDLHGVLSCLAELDPGVPGAEGKRSRIIRVQESRLTFHRNKRFPDGETLLQQEGKSACGLPTAMKKVYEYPRSAMGNEQEVARRAHPWPPKTKPKARAPAEDSKRATDFCCETRPQNVAKTRAASPKGGRSSAIFRQGADGGRDFRRSGRPQARPGSSFLIPVKTSVRLATSSGLRTSALKRKAPPVPDSDPRLKNRFETFVSSTRKGASPLHPHTSNPQQRPGNRQDLAGGSTRSKSSHQRNNRDRRRKSGHASGPAISLLDYP